MKRIMVMFAVLAFVLSAAGVGQAVPLSDLLLNGGSITAGDKRFDNWSTSFYRASDGRSFNPGNIDVTTLADGGLNPGPGLRFAALNGELSVTGDGILAFVDLTFGFRVSVLDPTLAIKDVSLEILSAALSSDDLNDGYNDDGSFIRESVGTAAGLDNLGVLNAEFSILDSVQTSDLAGSAAFAPRSEIWVTKNIYVWAEETTDSASLGNFEQRFSQEPVGTPEPGTLLLLAGGLASLFAGRRMFGRHDG